MVRTSGTTGDDEWGVDDGIEHESVRIERGSRSGLTVVVAVHSTALGPAIGGCRLLPYPSWRVGVADALALSVAMTEKAALAGLPHGGGKTVVVLPPGPLEEARREAVIHDVAGVIADLGGRYLTGPDIGTGPADMQVIHDRTGFAFCRPASTGGSGDSASATARGVLASMQAAARHVFGTGSWRGRRVGMIGFGQVGVLLGRMLVERGAQLAVTDLDPRRRDLATATGARWVDAEELLTGERDILVPAATGGLLTDAVAASLRCRLVVGPANNQLDTDAVADLLHERGILWVPDTVAGAGGILRAVAVEEHGRDDAQAGALVDGIGDTVAAVLSEADQRCVTPLAVVRGRAARLRDQARTRAASSPTERAGRR